MAKDAKKTSLNMGHLVKHVIIISPRMTSVANYGSEECQTPHEKRETIDEKKEKLYIIKLNMKFDELVHTTTIKRNEKTYKACFEIN